MAGSKRKFILNAAVIGAAVGAISNIRRTVKGPRDWRVAAIWVAWGLTTAVAIVTLKEQIDAQQIEAGGD